MFKDREKLYQVYHTMLSIGLTWALALAINNYYQLKVPVFLCAVFSFVPAFLIYLFDMNRKSIFTYLIIISLFPIAAFLFWVSKVNPFFWINEFIKWCNTYNGTEELYIAAYANSLILCVASVGAIVFYLLMKKQITKIFLAVVFMAMLIILSLNHFDINKAVVGICIFYILSILVELCGTVYSKKVGKQDKKAGILYLAPICLLLAILSISLPSKAEPIQWTTVRKIYASLKEQINIWKIDLDYLFRNSGGDFAINFTGYDEEGGALGSGGRLNKDDKIAMNVSGFKGEKPLYLIGSVSDIYTGNSWEKSKLDFTPGEEEYILDYKELLYALSRQDVKVLEEKQFVKRRSLNIEFYNMKSKTCFYPIKSSWIKTQTKKSTPITEYPYIKFSRALGRGSVYQSVFFEMNLKGEAFQEMLRDAATFSYEGVPNISSDTKTWLEDNLTKDDYVEIDLDKWDSYDILKSRADMIQRQYTVLPDTLPDRVKELAIEITKDYDNNYDKLKAIEKFLSAYQYTLQPEQIPEGKDFVDNFLFDQREGYCTYYASAMAVLARCVGIPTRYVEGFVVTFEEGKASSMYPIKNSQSHAWAEAYIKGVGWIPFEATAPYYDIRYTTWEESSKSEGSGFSEFNNPYIPSHREDEIIITDQEDKALTQEVEDKYDILTGVVTGIVTILIILLIIIIYYLTLKIKYKNTFKKADYSKKMYMLFLRILNQLQREGFVLEQQETVRMLAQRVGNKFRYEKRTFHNVANIFMRYRYAQAAVTKEEFEQVNVFHQGLKNKQRAEVNRFLLLLNEFLFLSKKSNR